MKKIFTLLLVIMASISIGKAETGTCGENLTWSLDNRVLTISGTGAMYDFTDYSPWKDYYIDTVIINEGITKIGSYAFYECGCLCIKMLSEQPCELGTNITNCSGTEILVSCNALDAYHSAWDSYRNWEEYIGQWSNYSPLWIHGPQSPYIITRTETEGGWINIPEYTACDKFVEIEANPRIGYYFVQWEDGSSDNPRTIELNKDITVGATFAPYTEGKCGPNLTWKYENHVLTIQGSGEMWCDSVYDDFHPEYYKKEAISWAGVKENITKVIVSEGATNIGSGVFDNCRNIKDISIASTVKVIGYYTFSDCDSIETITCYGAQPPMVRILLDGCSGYESFPVDMPQSTIIYVPADYVSTYKAHSFWGQFDVRPLQGQEAIEMVDDDKIINVHKIVYKGQILIQKNGKIYTLQGAEVK